MGFVVRDRDYSPGDSRLVFRQAARRRKSDRPAARKTDSEGDAVAIGSALAIFAMTAAAPLPAAADRTRDASLPRPTARHADPPA